MKTKITAEELYKAAERVGLGIQHDCGGYRVVKLEGDGFRYIFPRDGVSPTLSKRACLGFLLGVEWQSLRDSAIVKSRISEKFGLGVPSVIIAAVLFFATISAQAGDRPYQTAWPYTADYNNSLFIDPLKPGYLGERVPGQWPTALLREHWHQEAKRPAISLDAFAVPAHLR